MKFTMTKLAAGLALAAAAAGAQATTFDFTNSTVATTPFPGAANTSTFNAGAEFRMVDPAGNLGGGFPLQKTTPIGAAALSWTYDNTTNQMVSVAGTTTTGGAFAGAAPLGATSIDLGATFFGPSFGFLAPTVGSLAAGAYGVGTVTLGGLSDGVANIGDTFTVFMPTLEAQWGGTYFPLANISFSGTIIGAGGEYNMWAQHLITTAEDPGSAGFANWTAQWNYHGNVTGLAAAVPEASTYGMMLAGLGLVGFAVRRRNQA